MITSQPESQEISRIAFEYNGKKLEYVVTDALTAECPLMLSQASQRKYTEMSYKNSGLPLPKDSLDYQHIRDAGKKQTEFYDSFCALNEHLKQYPGALIRAYQLFTSRFSEHDSLAPERM